METQNEPTNKAAEIAGKIAHATAFNLILPYILEKAIKKAAWLALPVINPIFIFITKYYYNMFYEEQSLNLFFAITNFKTKQQGEEAKKAVTDLAEAINNGVSDEELKKLSEEFDARMRDAINFNN